MKHLLFAIAFVIFGTSFGATLAYAHQPQCGPVAMLHIFLKNKYQEAVRHEGTSLDNMVALWVSEDRSWSLELRMPTGVSCLFASGEDWQDVPWLLGLDATPDPEATPESKM